MEKTEKVSLFTIQKCEGYTLLKLRGDLPSERSKELADRSSEIIGDPVNHVIVNCDHLTGMSKNWIRVLLQITLSLKKAGKHIRFILVSRGINEMLVNEGLNKTFLTSLNLRDALVSVGLMEKKQLDTDFINPFLAATLQVLKVQAGIVAVPGKIYIRTGKNDISADISGVIGLVSDSFNGTVVISFPETTFLAIISQMLSEAFSVLNEEIADGAGELTNMIFGQAKIVLNEMGYGIRVALPSVVTGKGHSVLSQTKGPVVVVPFTTDRGPFFIEIGLSG